MSTRMSVLFVFTCQFLLFTFSLAHAKPPDLPAEEKVKCQEHGPGDLQSAPSYVPGGAIELEEPPLEEPRETKDNKIFSLAGFDCSCLRMIVEICWKDLKESNRESAGVPAGESNTPAETQEIPDKEMQSPPASSGDPNACTCPYLKQLADKKKPALAAAGAGSKEILENIGKLERARALLRQAERLQNDGETDQACQIYEQLRCLCPGSRFDRLAKERLDEMNAAKAKEQNPVGEEQERTDSKRDADHGKKKPLSSRLERRFYQIEDLISGKLNLTPLKGLLSGWRESQEIKNNQTKKINEDQIIKIIISTIEPRSWDAAGGPGTIEYDRINKVVVVQQAMDVQEQVEELLNAIRRLNDLPTRYNSEEQENKPEHHEKKEPATEKPVEEQVAELLEDCQRALTDGRYAEAEQLADRALALDTDCVAAHALVYKTHLLIQLEEKRRPVAGKSGVRRSEKKNVSEEK